MAYDSELTQTDMSETELRDLRRIHQERIARHEESILKLAHDPKLRQKPIPDDLWDVPHVMEAALRYLDEAIEIIRYQRMLQMILADKLQQCGGLFVSNGIGMTCQRHKNHIGNCGYRR